MIKNQYDSFKCQIISNELIHNFLSKISFILSKENMRLIWQSKVNLEFKTSAKPFQKFIIINDHN